MTKLYMKVTDDEYELPIAVADTMAELARMIGKSAAAVRLVFCRNRKGIGNSPTYVEVEISED